MELLQLKYFETVARYNSVTKASSELYVSQPTISKSLSRLEKEIGVTLFERRKGKELHLNQYGQSFYEKISNALVTIDRAVESVQNEAGFMVGDFSINIRYFMVWVSDIQECIEQFRTYFPLSRIRCIFSHGPQEEQTAARFYFYSDPDTPPCDEHVVLSSMQMLLAVSPDNLLANRKTIELSEALAYPFVFYSDLDSLYKYVLKMFESSRIAPKTIFAHGKEEVATLIAENKAVTVVTDRPITRRVLGKYNLVYLQIQGGLDKRAEYLGWNSEFPLTPFEKEFINHTQNFYRNAT